eukprot:TRINITY_DN14780_c0_g1_i1.p1 TRINITY_DN14780_c0_g1~~TRINITY_DN14780_c0_g1_i1.p1  ORF type:complete len:1790 (+),score=604.91 TRINITY_DN14780_c0_g1_i1:213-5582(+)
MQTTQSFEARSGPPEVHNVDALLREALEKLKNAAPKKSKELRDECEAGLEKIHSSANVAPINGDDYFKALKYGCECQGVPKVVVTALDTIQKMLQYGFLTGKGPDPFAPAAGRTLMDSIVDSIVNCADQADDTVQFHMIGALRTAATTQTCEMHGNSLMAAVKKIFQIHQDSKNAMNQRTAQASLTQMLSHVTQRMELSSAEMSRRSVVTFEDGDAQRKQMKQATSKDLELLPPGKLLEDGAAKEPEMEDEDAMETEEDPVCSHACKYRNLERLNLVETHYGGGGTSAPSGADVEPHSADAAGNGDSKKEHAEDISSVTTATSLATGTSLPSSFATNVEENGSAATNGVDGGLPDAIAVDKSLNPYHSDALMVFTSLCKLSMKDMPAGQTDTRVVRSKKLALELILNMLQNCGPVFRSSEPFIAVLKNSLCLSLIKNSVSSIPKIFGLSLQIFVTLMPNFKNHLRTEIGVFIEQIFLRILESGNSTYQHKHRVLSVFSKLCTDASTALEIFLNFDCDVDEKNIFAHMIDCLSKIAQGKYTSTEHANIIQPHQEQELKMLALQALVTLMGSIVDWSRRMTVESTQKELEDRREPTREGESDEDDSKSEATEPVSEAKQSCSVMEQKQRKGELQASIHAFNMKPKRGIELLKRGGFITDDPANIAEFLLNTELGFDKTAIGDYIGEDKPLNKSVFHAMVDIADFKGTPIDHSLRSFLSTFRLPGEAQKIDRIMEKFADKWCLDNPGQFANPDCGFVLSFSIIMLQTDLNNPGIKKKMSKEDFVKNNRKINDGQDLPREYLEGLYDSVLKNPFTLKEDEELRTRLESEQAQGASQKFDLFLRETETIVNKSQELMKMKWSKQAAKNSVYVAAENVQHVRPLFEVACWPMLATLAVLLETHEQVKVEYAKDKEEAALQASSVELCIEGFKHCIRIAARFDMETERDAFVSSLAKFTYLTTIKEMKQKNIECIKALLAIGLSEGNNLGPSWQHVLHCISQLERLQLLGSKNKEDFMFFHNEDPETSPGGMSNSGGGIQRSSSTAGNQVLKRRAHGLGVSALVPLGQENRMVEMYNSENITSQIDPAQIDLLFNKSSQLGSQAIVHFVTQLARVSKEELALVDQPRIFSLNKLVEVALWNMNRLRYVWAKIWRVLSNHFVEVASHPNIRVSMYAIDSLKQLAMRFLEKDELSNYNFQAEFMRPFSVVMTMQGVTPEVKELIVTIVWTMVQTLAKEGRLKNMKSGWKIVLQIAHSAASEPANEAVILQAFSIIEKLIIEDYDTFIENFSDGIRSLLSFGQCNVNLQTSLKAIEYIVQAAGHLANRNHADPPTSPQNTSGTAEGSGAVPTIDNWLSLLRGLSLLVSDTRREVRRDALEGVFRILEKYGALVFNEEAWRMVFNGVIKPLFDDIHHQLQSGTQKPDGTAASWAAATGPPTCLAALTELVRLIDSHLEALSFLLDDVLKLIRNCVQHDVEAVARIGVEGFKQLLLKVGRKMSPDNWQKVTDVILLMFRDSMPTKLLINQDLTPQGELPFKQQEVIIQCVVHLLLIATVGEIVKEHYDHIPPSGIMTLLDALQRSIDFAQNFNQKIELRSTLKKLGFMREMKQLPGLLKQEREALSCSLTMLFQMQQDARMQESDYVDQAAERLKDLCIQVLENYVSKERIMQEASDAGAASAVDGAAAAGAAAASAAAAGGQAAAAAAASVADAARLREVAAVEREREVLSLVPTVSEVILRRLRRLRPELFARFAPDLFPILSELATVNSREVRLEVREVLVECVQPLVLAGAKAAPQA